jgi:hypothetical protein
MDLGDIVRHRGHRFYLRGLDPIGAEPRYVYLEDVRTGESISVALEQVEKEGQTERRLGLAGNPLRASDGFLRGRFPQLRKR